MASGIQAIPEIELAKTPTGSRNLEIGLFIPAKIPSAIPAGRPTTAAKMTRPKLDRTWVVIIQSLSNFISGINPGQSS